MWKLWLKWLLGVALAVFVISGLMLFKLSWDLPDVEGLASFEPAQTTRIYSRDGQVVATLFEEKRTPVRLRQVSPLLVKALVAVEDARFFEHHGVDWWGVGRALVANLARGEVDQGASTLTMQLARQRFLNQDVSYVRKTREIMLARRIEQRFAKEKILEYYLNNVYFGSGAYGVASASSLYFGTSPERLSLAQSALLVGLLQAPSKLSPLVDRQAALARMHVVLERMRSAEVIDEGLYHSALREGQNFRFEERQRASEPLLRHPYFTTYVIAQLAQKYSEDALYRGGLKVNTTLDVKLQSLAEEEVRACMADYGPGVNADSAALVLIENQTGAIRAMVGGRGWSKHNQFNRAWQAMRQPGSSFKPFIYAAALEQGMSADTLVEDSPLTIGDWTPSNSDGRYYGRLTLRQALQLSRNVVSARLCQQVGPDRVVRLAHNAGIAEPLTDNLAISLGTSEVTPLSMAVAYATIASGGVYHPPMAVTQVVAPTDKVLRDNRRTEGVRKLSVAVCAQLVDMMMSVVEGGTGQAAALEGVQVAGKTGTTDESRDAWFAGSTPGYTMVVWVGNDDHSPMWQVYGGGLPALIWQRVMSQVEVGVTEFAFVRRVPAVVAPTRLAEKPKVGETPRVVETPKVVEKPRVVESPRAAPTPAVAPTSAVAPSPSPEVRPTEEFTPSPEPEEEPPFLPEEEPLPPEEMPSLPPIESNRPPGEPAPPPPQLPPVEPGQSALQPVP